MNNRWFSFDPNKSFLKLKVLWVFVLGITFTAFTLAMIIIYHSNLGFRPDYIGFNQFLTYFKIPLGLWALSIPIVALLAANHRSEQTKEQIKIAASQNIFSNHYKHIEEFEKHYISHKHKSILRIRNPRKTHSIIFPKTFDGDYKVHNGFLELLTTKYNKIVNELQLFSAPNFNVMQIVANVERYLTKTEELLSCEYIVATSGDTFEFGDVTIKLDKLKLKSYLDVLKRRINELNMILQFDHSYKEFKLISILSNLDLSIVPDISLSNSNRSTAPFNLIPRT